MLFEQDAFEIVHALAGIGDRLFQLVLRDTVAADQEVELCGSFFRCFLEVEKGNAQSLGDFVDSFFVLSCKTAPTFLVEQLKHAHEVLIICDNRVSQDLFGLEAGAFVVGRVVE